MDSNKNILMKYFYDTEFLEGTQKKRWWNIGKQKPTIDLISIGVVCEDGREYYAISKDFNLKEAWNRYDEEIQHFYGDLRNQFSNGRKQKKYWIRENVLKPIYYDWVGKDINFHEVEHFTYKNFKRLLKKYGKSNSQIAEELKHFIYEKENVLYNKQELDFDSVGDILSKIQLYGYYSAYDHVALSWLFGKMIDLPKGFPMYTIDLKQISDEVYNKKKEEYLSDGGKNFITNHLDYPKQHNEHNALSDAIFVKNLYHFLKNIIVDLQQ